MSYFATKSFRSPGRKKLFQLSKIKLVGLWVCHYAPNRMNYTPLEQRRLLRISLLYLIPTTPFPLNKLLKYPEFSVCHSTHQIEWIISDFPPDFLIPTNAISLKKPKSEVQVTPMSLVTSAVVCRLTRTKFQSSGRFEKLVKTHTGTMGPQAL